MLIAAVALIVFAACRLAVAFIGAAASPIVAPFPRDEVMIPFVFGLILLVVHLTRGVAL